MPIKSLSQMLFEERLQKQVDEVVTQLKSENENLKNQIIELQQSLGKEEIRITANKQLLILHYIGILDIDKFPSKEKKYDLMHRIIDKSRQTVKNFFNYRDQIKTVEFGKIFNEEDLNYVSAILKEVGLNDIAKKVDQDIIKYKF